MHFDRNELPEEDKRLKLCEKSGDFFNLRCKPIGIFDSGLGGLTLFKEFKKLMPGENIVYFGDTARVPYGAKNKDEIKKCTAQDVNFLNTFSPKIIVAACGTVSSYLTHRGCVDSKAPIGIIKPTCLSAAKKTFNRKIGVMCTEATEKSQSYKKFLTAIDSKLEVFTVGCPKLVDIIESKDVSEKKDELKSAVVKYSDVLLSSGVDTLILGCTHYPIIKDIIKEVVGNSVSLVDSGLETAKFVRDYIMDNSLENDGSTQGYCRFYVSGDTAKFSDTAKIFLRENISENVFKIDINRY